MNILLCLPSLAHGKGGTERVASDLGIAMRARNHHISYAYKTKPTSVYAQPQYPVPADAELVRYDVTLRGMRDFRKHVRALNPQIIMIFYAGCDVFELYDALHDLDIPLCFQECSNPQRILSANWINAPNANLMRTEMLIKSAGVRVTQPAYIESFSPAVQPLVHAFPNAFMRVSDTSNKRASHTILHVGGAKKNKKLEDMLDAFGSLFPSFPDWKLMLATLAHPIPQPHYLELKRRIENEFPPGSVILEENVEDMTPLYAQADIHCITSMSEGLPNCVCEAMCQGTPSVGFSKSIGTNLLIQDGIDGLLAGDGPKALAQSLATLMDNPELTSKLGKKAWEEAIKFDPKIIYDNWEEFFQTSLRRAKMRTGINEHPNIASLCESWDSIRENTWFRHLANKINTLSGEIIFYGCGSLYKEFKHLFSHLKPVCVVVDTDLGQNEIDGIKVITFSQLDNYPKSLPIAIFSEKAKVIEHRLRSVYGVKREIICIDIKVLCDKYFPASTHPLSPVKVKERFERIELGLPTSKVNEEPFTQKVNTEHPDCAFCGSNHTVPYMTSNIIPWYGGEIYNLVRCEKCGLVYNSPRPTEEYAMAEVSKAGEMFYERKLNRPNVQQIHERHAKQILLQKPDARTVFDVAFGAGTLLHAFRNLGLEASGNEINDFACQKLRDQGFEVFNLSTRRLNLHERFDIITMLDYLEHTYTPFDDLLKAHDMLNPNGILHLKTLFLGCRSHILKGELWQLFGKGHFYFYLPSVLSGMVENAGFEIIKLRLGDLIHITAKKI